MSKNKSAFSSFGKEQKLFEDWRRFVTSRDDEDLQEQGSEEDLPSEPKRIKLQTFGGKAHFIDTAWLRSRGWGYNREKDDYTNKKGQSLRNHYLEYTRRKSERALDVEQNRYEGRPPKEYDI